MVKWSLDDAVQHQLRYPYTFFIPSNKTIEKLQVKDKVKLMFLILERENEKMPFSERMWVKITKIDNDDFKGVLENKPVYIEGLNVGDEISFNTKNICSTLIKDEEVIKQERNYLGNYVLVSRDVLVKKYFNFMMKEEPKNKSDVGWVFFTGFEDDEFISKSKNFKYVPLGTVLNLDDAIFSILYEDPPCAYERSFLTGMLEKIENLDLDE